MRTVCGVTYSIVAFDHDAGQWGVAVQSHYFAVGSVVPWAEAGVGAVATQSIAERSYGPNGLDRMRSGDSASVALAALTAEDRMEHLRQVAMVDAAGGAAVHTGANGNGGASRRAPAAADRAGRRCRRPVQSAATCRSRSPGCCPHAGCRRRRSSRS